MREKVSKNANSLISNPVQYLKGINDIIIKVLSFLLSIPFLAGSIIVYRPSQGTNKENYFDHIFYRGKNADFGGN